MIEPTDLDWLALCLVTESNRPDEWPYIAQVIENRRATGRWGNTYRDVILAPKQFSAFNDFTKHDVAPALVFKVVAGTEERIVLMHAAAFCGAGPQEQTIKSILSSPQWSESISSATLHYYSPVSMKPPGSTPPWAVRAERLYTPPGIDPRRFVFAEAVP